MSVLIIQLCNILPVLVFLLALSRPVTTQTQGAGVSPIRLTPWATITPFLLGFGRTIVGAPGIYSGNFGALLPWRERTCPGDFIFFSVLGRIGRLIGTLFQLLE
jgi:hypothetical protein